MQVAPKSGAFRLAAQDQPLTREGELADVPRGGHGRSGLLGDLANQPPVQPTQRPFSPARLHEQLARHVAGVRQVEPLDQ